MSAIYPITQVVLAETAIVSGALTVVFIVIHIILMIISASFSMSHLGIFATVFASGATLHLLYERYGINKQLCARFMPE
jgi:hypothetical protein